MTLRAKLFGLFLSTLIFQDAGSAVAASVALEWDPSPDSDLAGYKLYYQADSSTIPFTGAGATNGPAPIDMGNVLTYTIEGLDEDHNQYFAVTAYNTAGLESVYSNIVEIPWQPALKYPAKNQTDTPLEFDFVWRAAVAPAGTTYTLYYGTDPDLMIPSTNPVGRAEGTNGEFKSRGGSSTGVSGMLVFSMALLGALSGLVASGTRLVSGIRFAPAGAAFLIAISFAGCGPGLLSDRPSSAPDQGTTEAIPNLTDPTVHVSQWKPNTTYYWKVVAHTPTGDVPSWTYSFTTVR